MSLITPTTPLFAATASRKRLLLALRRLGRLVDNYVASLLAEFERRAEIHALRRLSDRQLRDIGLSRHQIDGGLAEAARDRLEQQRLHGI